MRKYSGKILITNTFGALGYMFCLLLWTWIGILYLPMLLQNETIEKLVIPTPSDESAIIQPVIEPSPVTAIAAAIVTVVVIIVTIVALLIMPKTIAKTGKNVTTKAASKALPIASRGKKLTPVKKQRLTASLIKLTKLTLVLLPVIISLLGAIIQPPIDFEITILVSSLLAICSVVWFGVQYGLARLFSIDSNQLV